MQRCELCFWGENFLGLPSMLSSTVRPSLRLDFAERVVFSPHVYGPGTNSKMFYFNRTAFPDFPDNMAAIWKQHFLDPVRAYGGALVVGEWGGEYTGADEMWQDRFKAFLLEEGLSSFYWALNPNSGSRQPILRSFYFVHSTCDCNSCSPLPSLHICQSWHSHRPPRLHSVSLALCTIASTHLTQTTTLFPLSLNIRRYRRPAAGGLDHPPRRQDDSSLRAALLLRASRPCRISPLCLPGLPTRSCLRAALLPVQGGRGEGGRMCAHSAGVQRSGRV